MNWQHIATPATGQTSSYHKHHRRKIQSTHRRLTAAAATTCERHKMLPSVRRFSAGRQQSTSAIITTMTSRQTELLTLTFALLVIASAIATTNAQQPQIVTLQPQRNSYLLPGHNMENLRIPESQQVGSVIHQLKAMDKSEPTRKITYALTGDFFRVDEDTGEVRLVRQLDRERKAEIKTVVNVLGANSDQPLESRQRTVIIEDADDSWPTFASHKSSLVHNPQQGHYVFQAEISELAPVGTLVLSELIVSDADEGANAEMIFECRARASTNNACDSFAIDSRRLAALSIGGSRYSVTIRTRQPLDYERQQQFKLALVARGKRPSPLKGAPLEAEAMVNINVLNVQDEGPTFVNAPYSLSMDEGLPEGQRLLRLIVQDGDLAPQRNLNVFVLEGPLREYFQVTRDPEHTKIWFLETKKTIDREDPRLAGQFANNNLFTIHLLAVELNEAGEPMASEPELEQVLAQDSSVYNRMLLRREPVSVMLRDLPDTAPLFVRTSSGELIENNFLAVNVSESLATGASVPNLDLTALDLDQGANSRFRLTLVDGEMGPLASEAFALESEIVNGKTEIVLNVLNSTLLDYEEPTRRVFRFHLVASKQAAAPGAQPLVSKLDLQLHLMDANDNWPEFVQDQYQVSVPEGSPPGALVAQIRAHDRDSGLYGQVNHNLYGLGASKFQVSPHDGKIMVADCAMSQCLDYETQPSYLLTYVAHDGGGQSRNVSLIIQVEDVNDHAPKFQELVYKRELISDNLSRRQNYISPQLIVRAYDEDGPSQGRNNITYRIRSSNLTGLDVDPTSGLVYISQPLDLDTLIASQDSAMAAAAMVTVGATGGSGRATSGSGPNQINYHQRRIVFEAEVVAEDNGTPPLNSSAIIWLLVKGNRDGAPQFKQDLYQAYVHESQPPGKPFFQVQAVDPDDKDSRLRYSLGFDPNDLVAIDAHTGQLSFKQRIDFDDFNGVPYNITVYATDNSKPYPLRASALVSIVVQDVNNKSPRFAEREYRALLAQGRTHQGDVVAQVAAVDLDLNARLNYSLLPEMMSVNDRNGQRFTLDELANSTSGYLAQMARGDRARLVADFKRLLAINPRTGAIELKWEPDYAFAASLSVRVRVVDLNQEVYMPTGELQEDFAECQLFLQTHIDKSPIFAPPWTHERRDYNISLLEELPLETPVFSLLAKDPQTGQRVDSFEKVHESDPRDYFRVERSTGRVLVNRRIDYEELPTPKRLQLTVRAFGNGGGVAGSGEPAYSTANINVQVVDLNDNAPQFRNVSYYASVSEAITSAHEILTVSAEDRDSSDLGQVYYSLSGFGSHLFHIHPRKGLLTLRKNARLDRDTEANYLLVATASDCNETLHAAGLTGSHHLDSATTSSNQGLAISAAQAASSCKRSSVPLEITVLDENDNDPVFVNTNKRGEYEATSSETVSVNSVITQVVAHDPDEGPNGQVSYAIVRTDEPVTRLLSIDQDGYISASGSLSGAGRPTPYRITVRAYDAGTKQSRQSFATLLLTISDVVENDGVPRFLRPRPDEVVELPESAGPSTFVYQVQAVDPDEEANGKLMYKFISPSDTFEIDPFTGFIKTQNRLGLFLDREQVPNYTLIIVAQDLGSPPKQAHQVLTIRVGDINDNEPYFERAIDDPPLALYVEEELPAGTLVGTVQAIDKDIGQNALIGYDIIEGNQNNLFRLSWDAQATAATTTTTTQVDNNDSTSLTAMTTTGGNNPCRIYTTSRLDSETRNSYTLTIKASSMSKMRNQLLHHRDPLGNRNPFNQYNASDLTKLRVTINLIDINDNRPVFVQPNAKSVVDSSAEIYSQLMVVKALDADSSSSEMRYSILDAFYFSDSNYFAKTPAEDPQERYGTSVRGVGRTGGEGFASMKYVFDVHPTTGILRNSVSLRPFTDGYFEVFIKADSSGPSTSSGLGSTAAGETGSTPSMLANGARPPSPQDGQCAGSPEQPQSVNNVSLPAGVVGDVVENCHVAITKVVVFVTHQRETFRFVFNKTKLNDRLDEFREKIQSALEGLMFEPARVQASIADQSRRAGSSLEQLNTIRAERVYLNTFNTDFYERDDGSLDFATITSCSQLVKFDDRSNNGGGSQLASRQYGSSDLSDSTTTTTTTLVPNQVVSYDDVLSLLKTLNATQISRQQQQQQLKSSSLFSQYGLVKIERCLPDKTMYKMTLSERMALYFAAMIALISILLAFIVSNMRKSYEKNLRIHKQSISHQSQINPVINHPLLWST